MLRADLMKKTLKTPASANKLPRRSKKNVNGEQVSGEDGAKSMADFFCTPRRITRSISRSEQKKAQIDEADKEISGKFVRSLNFKDGDVSGDETTSKLLSEITKNTTIGRKSTTKPKIDETSQSTAGKTPRSTKKRTRRSLRKMVHESTFEAKSLFDESVPADFQGLSTPESDLEFNFSIQSKEQSILENNGKRNNAANDGVVVNDEMTVAEKVDRNSDNEIQLIEANISKLSIQDDETGRDSGLGTHSGTDGEKVSPISSNRQSLESISQELNIDNRPRAIDSSEFFLKQSIASNEVKSVEGRESEGNENSPSVNVLENETRMQRDDRDDGQYVDGAFDKERSSANDSNNQSVSNGESREKTSSASPKRKSILMRQNAVIEGEETGDSSNKRMSILSEKSSSGESHVAEIATESNSEWETPVKPQSYEAGRESIGAEVDWPSVSMLGNETGEDSNKRMSFLSEKSSSGESHVAAIATESNSEWETSVKPQSYEAGRESIGAEVDWPSVSMLGADISMNYRKSMIPAENTFDTVQNALRDESPEEVIIPESSTELESASSEIKNSEIVPAVDYLENLTSDMSMSTNITSVETSASGTEVENEDCDIKNADDSQNTGEAMEPSHAALSEPMHIKGNKAGGVHSAIPVAYIDLTQSPMLIQSQNEMNKTFSPPINDEIVELKDATFTEEPNDDPVPTNDRTFSPKSNEVKSSPEPTVSRQKITNSTKITAKAMDKPKTNIKPALEYAPPFCFGSNNPVSSQGRPFQFKMPTAIPVLKTDAEAPKIERKVNLNRLKNTTVLSRAAGRTKLSVDQREQRRFDIYNQERNGRRKSVNNNQVVEIKGVRMNRRMQLLFEKRALQK